MRRFSLREQFERQRQAMAGLHPPSAGTSPPEPRGFLRAFGNLRVRPKLIILHNLFFLLLGVAVYFAVIPPVEEHITRARNIETSLLTQILGAERPAVRLPDMAGYDYREGPARALRIPEYIRVRLLASPDQPVTDGDQLYRHHAGSGTFRRITLPLAVYESVLSRARVTLFVALGTLYILAVLLLEFVIMPVYVYRPLQAMLDADEAARTGDHDHELIPASAIPGDEIGQIMLSRNAAVAELRRHEDELAAALSHLEAQDRLASLGLLSAGVAHEMNTPLAVLHGSVEKLLERTTGDPAMQERLRRMLRVTERLRRLSEGLVDFARVRQPEMAPVALRPLVEDAWQLVAIDEKSATVEFSNEVPEDATASGSADRLVQVFVNLLRNALEAARDSGGRIAVRARRCTKEGRPAVAVAVEDNGPGIPAEVLPHIFEAFVSSRLDARGTGLGLTIAEGIVHQHGGSIVASNCPGGGARLEVTLRSAA